MKAEIILSDQYNPFLNLAVEQALFCDTPADTVVMYLWRNRRTVVIGCHQNPYTECHVEQLLADGGHLMRRTTGGGAVYHDLGNLNFTFVAPHELYDTGKQFSVLRKALEHFGLETVCSGRNDMLHNGRKFSGNAFSIGKNNRLHHGTLLIKTDMEALQRYLKPKPSKLHRHGVSSVESRVVNLSELAEITSENIVPPLIESFQHMYGKAQVRSFADCCTEQVHAEARMLADDEFVFGRWRQFRAQRNGEFAWGGVEMELEIGEADRRILHVEIATDCLLPNTVEKAKQLLTGADADTMPAFSASSAEEGTVLNDIMQLVYA